MDLGSVPSCLLAFQSGAHAPGTLLPKGFFLFLGLLYLLALAADRWATRLGVPAALTVLLVGLVVNVKGVDVLSIDQAEVETLHVISLALLLFYAGLKTDLRRIRGHLTFALLLSTVGVVVTLFLLGFWLVWLGSPGGDLLAMGWHQRMPWGAALLTAACLMATDGSATEDLLQSLRRWLPSNVSDVLQFEAALSNLAAILCFGLIAAFFQDQAHGGHGDLHAAYGTGVGHALLNVLKHLLAGVLAGLLVGLGASVLIDRLLREHSQLLVLAISVAFVAYGLGNVFGGGGIVAVYVCGLLMSNWHYRDSWVNHEALQKVLLPFNTLAEYTILFLLAFLVRPEQLLRILPFGLATALILLIVVRPLAVLILHRSSQMKRGALLAISFCGVRAAVPLALSLSLVFEVPELRGVSSAAAESLGENLASVVFIVILVDLVIQGLLARPLVRRMAPMVVQSP
jgi:cell volume regulation protein A